MDKEFLRGLTNAELTMMIRAMSEAGDSKEDIQTIVDVLRERKK